MSKISGPLDGDTSAASPAETNPTRQFENDCASDFSGDPVAVIAETAASERSDGRGILGIGFGGDRIPSLARCFAESGVGWYGLIALSFFAAIDTATGYLVAALGPDISNTLGISPSTFAMLATQRQTLVGLTALQFARNFYKRPDRARFSKMFGLQYGPVLAIGSFITWPFAMTLVVGQSGVGAAVVWSAHRPLLMDMYPPRTRLRVLGIHTGAAVAGGIVSLFLVAGLSAAGLTWRGIMLVAGLLFLVLGWVGVRLRDPGWGRFDSDRIAQLMHRTDGEETLRTGDPSDLTFSEAVRRVWMIPTVRRMMAVWAVLGVALTPVVSYQGFWLEEQFNLTAGQRSLFLATGWILTLPVLIFFTRKGEGIWRSDPKRLMRLTAASLSALAVGLALAIVPILGVSLLGFSLVFAAQAVAFATLSLATLTVVRPRCRPIAAGLAAFFFGLVGGEGGTLLLGGVASRYSAAIAIGILIVPAAGAALLLRASVAALDADLDCVVEEILEDEGAHSFVRRGVKLPLLSCQGVDFSYGQLQVLFDVDFTIQDGEMLALLGVNGAGKSTLLNVISGIGIPSSGSVRLDGVDITYLDAERRVGMGITQIAGGRAVFGPLSVIENLRGYGYSLGRDRRRLDAAIDECFEAFPRLAERRHQNAVTLSGGEQQMLALSKAFILKPRLLLVDELSLGLAPVVVDLLLDMVRRINASGTAIALVEQSMSIALDAVDHAYFMEKGEIRFDGSSSDLLARDDLFRAVFLGSALERIPGA